MVKIFTPFKPLFKTFLNHVIQSPLLHARWLNTLSYMENCGAKKLAGCEHPTIVKEVMLKHAAEEFRHAYYLKSQIRRVTSIDLPDYMLSNMIGGYSSLYYLARLDIKICRYLLQQGVTVHKLKELAYILVTYAIEKRAAELYPLYDQLLRQHGSKVMVKSIAMEEEEHLQEMEAEIDLMPSGNKHAKYVCDLEARLCQSWLYALLKATKSHV